MIGDKETSEEHGCRFIKQNLLFDGPDPFFPPQHKRKKKQSGYARLASMQYSNSQKYILHSADRASITPQPTW